MKKTKSRYRIWKVLKNILFYILAAFVIWIIFSTIMTGYEQTKYKPIGEVVEVDGENIHIYTRGEGADTIVLLSGLGTAAPALDFYPIINEMSKNNKVVVVEPFGYGWSDITEKERTVENIVEEIRVALKNLTYKARIFLCLIQFQEFTVCILLIHTQRKLKVS